MSQFIWISVLIVFASPTLVEGKIGEACYGTDLSCDYFSLTCAQNEIIRLGTLRYGLKEQPICKDIENHCQSKDICCRANTSDCSEDFDLRHTYEAYTNCSGRVSCSDVQSPWKLLNCNGEYNTPSYVSLQYECEEASRKLKFCRDANETGSKIEAMFDGSQESFDPTKASRECGCIVMNKLDTQQEVRLNVIDLRLQSYVRNENNTAQCSSAHFWMQGHINKVCTDSLHHEQDNFLKDQEFTVTLQAGHSTELLLEDLYVKGYDDSPAMVWLAIEAEASKSIDMHCREIFPLTTTTTTTSTTMTTTPTSTRTSTMITTSPATTTITQMTNTTKPTTRTVTTTAEATTPATEITVQSTEPTTTAHMRTAATKPVVDPITTSVSNETAAPVIAGEDSEDEQKIKLFLAIFVPVAVVCLIFAIILVCWLYRKFKTTRKKLYMAEKMFPLGENDLMANYIKKRNSFEIKASDSIVFGGRTRPGVYTVTAADLYTDLNPLEIHVYDTIKQNEFPTTYITPVTEGEESHHFKMGFLRNDMPPNSHSSCGSRNNSQTEQPETEENVIQDKNTPNITRNNHQGNNHVEDNQTSKPLPEKGVVIHVDNTQDVMSVRSTLDRVSPQSESPAAVIVPELVTNRNSGTAHVIPGDTPKDYSSLYIK